MPEGNRQRNGRAKVERYYELKDAISNRKRVENKLLPLYRLIEC